MLLIALLLLVELKSVWCHRAVGSVELPRGLRQQVVCTISGARLLLLVQFVVIVEALDCAMSAHEILKAMGWCRIIRSTGNLCDHDLERAPIEAHHHHVQCDHSRLVHAHIVVLPIVETANFGYHVVFVLARDDKHVLATVAVAWLGHIETQQIEPELADALVELADFGPTHAALVVGVRVAGISEIDEAFGGELATADVEQATDIAGAGQFAARAAALAHGSSAPPDALARLVAGAVSIVGRHTLGLILVAALWRPREGCAEGGGQ